MIKHGGGYFEAVCLKPSHRVMQFHPFCYISSFSLQFVGLDFHCLHHFDLSYIGGLMIEYPQS